MEYVMQERIRTSRIRVALKRVAQLCIGIGLAVCVLPTSMAQVPDAIMNASGPLSPSQQATLQQFVSGAIGDLQGADSKAAKNAGRQLIAPLNRRLTTRSFRNAYASILAPELQKVAGNDDLPIYARLTALNILGTLASDEILPILSQSLSSEFEAIRYNSALAYQRALEAIGEGRDTFADEHEASRSIVRKLHESMSGEKSPFVFGALISACGADPDSRYALLNICKGLQSQMKARYRNEAPSAMIGVYKNGLQTAMKRYISLLGQGGDLMEQEKALVQTGVMALQLAIVDGKRGAVTEMNRQAYADLVQGAENLIDVVCRLDSIPGVSQNQRKAVSMAFNAGNYQIAENSLKSFWLTPSGPVYGNRSFGFPVGSFDNLLDG